MQKILVINAGSSSVKFQLLDFNTLEVQAKGLCERIKVDGYFKIKDNITQTEYETSADFKDFKKALNFVLEYLISKKLINDKEDIIAIGHRIVHGGTKVTEACIATKDVIKTIEGYTDLAPLHIPPELDALNEMIDIFPKAKQILVFDTSFHKTIPYINYMYGVKNEWLNKYEVRRFGFHGISYHYVTEKMKQILNKEKVNLIICHLGSGASLCAVKDSKSVSTSMGFSALDGLVMCTRTGDISPTVISYMAKKLNKSYDEIIDICTKESGLKGLTGFSDMRDVIDHIDQEEVKKGYDVFIKRIVNYICISLNDIDNQLDALVFCGGIVEHSTKVRQDIINGLKLLNLKIDNNKNNNYISDYIKISSNDSSNDIYVVNTNEELMIAKEVKRILLK